MLFNSFNFAIFFTVIFIAYWIMPNKYRGPVLLIGSYYFYACFNVKYIFLLFLTTLLSWLFSKKIETADNKKIYLNVSLILIIGILFIFKYLDFLFVSINSIISSFTIRFNDVLLPIGISFYSFEVISYLVDVYKGKITAEKNFLDYALFVSFFPTITSGPIERASNLLPQIKKEKKFDYVQGTYGLKLITFGLLKKMVIADNLGVIVDKVFNNVTAYQGFALVIAVVFYSIQIYCDFSGYSEMARGISKLLGIELIENFKTPYFSTTIKEFWGKWHISLSSWLKDYIYIPLGGSRCSKLKHYFNILITFLISGLWHGANITFVAWGTIHGVLQILEDLLKISSVKKKYSFVWFFRVFALFVIISFAWIFFRSNSISDAMYILKNMFVGIDGNYIRNGLDAFNFGLFDICKKVLLYILPIVLIDLLSQDRSVVDFVSNQKPVLRYMCYLLLMIYVVFFHYVGEVSFVYFKF